MNYIPEATQKHIDDLVKTINRLNKERNKLTAENKAQAEQLILSGVGISLPKVCTGCGSLSTKVIDKKYLACCPDNQYIELEDYCKKSIYKPELFNK
jgi:hypothetical protein